MVVVNGLHDADCTQAVNASGLVWRTGHFRNFFYRGHDTVILLGFLHHEFNQGVFGRLGPTHHRLAV